MLHTLLTVWKSPLVLTLKLPQNEVKYFLDFWSIATNVRVNLTLFIKWIWHDTFLPFFTLLENSAYLAIAVVMVICVRRWKRWISRWSTIGRNIFLFFCLILQYIFCSPKIQTNTLLTIICIWKELKLPAEYVKGNRSMYQPPSGVQPIWGASKHGKYSFTPLLCDVYLTLICNGKSQDSIWLLPHTKCWA